MMIPEEQMRRIEECFLGQRGNVAVSNLSVLNAFLYMAENGCKRRALPRQAGRHVGRVPALRTHRRGPSASGSVNKPWCKVAKVLYPCSLRHANSCRCRFLHERLGSGRGPCRSGRSSGRGSFLARPKGASRSPKGSPDAIIDVQRPLPSAARHPGGNDPVRSSWRAPGFSAFTQWPPPTRWRWIR